MSMRFLLWFCTWSLRVSTVGSRSGRREGLVLPPSRAGSRSAGAGEKAGGWPSAGVGGGVWEVEAVEPSGHRAGSALPDLLTLHGATQEDEVVVADRGERVGDDRVGVGVLLADVAGNR